MVGKTLLHFNILEELGHGGMGVVYKAMDTKLKREVAIKFLPRFISGNQEERQRFEIEAQAAAALSHPNIATIYSIEETSEEVFIVMEYIEGKELKQVIEAHRESMMPLEEVVNYARQIADGLKAAHGKGITHRDIKSSNIMVTAAGQIKIMDFGLAKINGRAELTKYGSVIGTTPYMSPEQARGERLDQRSDVWSFGVVLYEMLTGNLPFRGNYEQAVIYSIVHEKHLPASEFRPDIPESLCSTIDRCLEKDPSQRFQEPESLIAGLESSDAKPMKTNAFEPGVPSIAVLPFADISTEQDNKYFSDGLTEEIITKLSKIRKARVISRVSVMNYNHAGKAMKQIAAELGVRYVIEGSVRKNGVYLRIAAQLIDASRDEYLWADKLDGTMAQVFDLQEAVAARIVKALKIRLTPEEKRSIERKTTENTEAYQYYLKGRFFWAKRTMDGLEKAINYFEKAIQADDKYALPWSGIADSYNLMGDYGTKSRREIYRKAAAAARRAVELDAHLSEGHASLAFLLMLVDWDWKNSLKEFKLALKYDPNYATAHHWYGEWLLCQGLIEDANNQISTAVDLEPLSAAILKDKGLFLYYSRDYDGAVELGLKSLELDPNLDTSHRLLSLAYLGKGRYPEAVAENKMWIDKRGDPVGSMLGLAYCYAAAGEKESAMRIVEDVTAKDEMEGNTARGIALVHAALGETDAAFSWLEKALESKADSMTLIKVDPKLDPLRDDPRFDTLVEKVGLRK